MSSLVVMWLSGSSHIILGQHMCLGLSLNHACKLLLASAQPSANYLKSSTRIMLDHIMRTYCTSVRTEVQAAGISCQSNQLRKLTLHELAPMEAGTPDDAARVACEKLVPFVVMPAESTPILVQCATCSDADRVLAAMIGCANGSIATSPGGITSMAYSREDCRLKEISTLNHCGHLSSAAR